MRQPARVVRVLRSLVILLALCFVTSARADDRTDARAHYQAGVRLYSSGDYQGAIREFSAAQQLVPADLNNYNLALCYDKLGDAEPAIQYYRAFLDRQPNSDKRAEVDASIHRLEAASRSAAAKKAEEARRADEARRAEDARRADDARRVSKADAAAAPGPAPAVGPLPEPLPAPGAASGPAEAPAPQPAPGAGPSTRRRTGPAIAGSIGSAGAATPTGDPQLDRATAIDVNEIRDQRFGATGGTAERRTGPAVAAADGAPQSTQAGQSPPVGPNVQPGGPDEPKKEAPVYKKWWFWVIVGVSAFVVYEVATTDSSSSQTVRARQLPASAARASAGGLTLLRW